MVAYQLPSLPRVELSELDMSTANTLLTEWGHYLGPCNRPFAMRAWSLWIDGIVSIAVSASIVSNTVAGFERQHVVELARLCSAPNKRWATRVMLRLWRECCAQGFCGWAIRAAVAYSQNARHEGTIYRFDGWRKVTDKAGTSSGGGAWTRKRYATQAALGPKTLWLWEYPP